MLDFLSNTLPFTEPCANATVVFNTRSSKNEIILFIILPKTFRVVKSLTENEKKYANNY